MVIKNANLNLKEIILTLDSIKKNIGIINNPPIVGVLLLLKCELGASVFIFCKKLYFLINLIPYPVEIVDAMTENIYRIKT
tara:strand:- start:411 stop:653 length:243 start_codon:yes stop_codon:yes gene_type:complete